MTVPGRKDNYSSLEDRRHAVWQLGAFPWLLLTPSISATETSQRLQNTKGGGRSACERTWYVKTFGFTWNLKAIYTNNTNMLLARRLAHLYFKTWTKRRTKKWLYRDEQSGDELNWLEWMVPGNDSESPAARWRSSATGEVKGAAGLNPSLPAPREV